MSDTTLTRTSSMVALPIKASILPTWLSPTLLASMLRGVEKEGLRMQSDGFLAQTPHPTALGSKLTHPFITTDYSESLLELITAPATSIQETLISLEQLHQLVYQALPEDELVWPMSMPCMLASEDADIPLAEYGTSNIGRLKTLYRAGLGLRYGRRMQTIAGLHYNLSFGDDFFAAWQQYEEPCADTHSDFVNFKNNKYLALIRNFKRMGSMLLYLTGASPAVCPCFLTGRTHDLERLNQATFYKPFATSLRMGKLGYTNSVQDQLDIRYNSLPEYVKGLQSAIATPFAPFTALGLNDAKGEPIQINDHILQIENEFYSPIRPKQITKAGETPSAALAARGVAYVEFRAVDLDPYAPVGITLHTACFLEVLALYCLLLPSAMLMPDEEAELQYMLDKVVNEGRDPTLTIRTTEGEMRFTQWMQQHLDAMQPIAALLDGQSAGDNVGQLPSHAYQEALAVMQARVHDPATTLSAKMLADIDVLGSVWKLGATLAQSHHATLTAQPLTAELCAHYDDIAQQSWRDQQAIEAQDTQPFTKFLAAYR